MSDDAIWGRLFTCAICRRDVTDYSNRTGRDRHLSPLCRRCEGYYGGRSPINSGAFMDRRSVRQIQALAEALHGEAATQQWRSQYGRA